MSVAHDDEIDLFELFQILWAGKWMVSAFIAVALAFGGGFIHLKDTAYKSNIVFDIDTIPPFYSKAKVLVDFQKTFYSISVFEQWKKNNKDASLVFGDFSTTQVIDGFVMSKDKDAPIAKIDKGSAFIVVKSNQLSLLDDFYRYAEHINQLLKDEYVSRANDELKIIEARFTDLLSADSSVVEIILSIDRYIASADNGDNVLFVERPSMPKKVSPKSLFVFALSFVLGGIIGAANVLIQNAIKTRRKQLV